MVRLSLTAFDILWQDLACSSAPQRVPYPLQIPSVGATMEERARIRASTYQELTEAGLCAAGVVDDALKEYFEILACAQTYVECEALSDVTRENAGLVRAVIALRSSDDRLPENDYHDCDGFSENNPTDKAVLVQQHESEGEIELRTVSSAESFQALISVLPSFAAGSAANGRAGRTGPASQSVRLPVSALTDRGEDPVFFSRGADKGFYHQEIGQVRTIQSRPVAAAGQFSVRKRDKQGRVNRVEGGSWFVNDLGGYFGAVQPGPGGEWISVEAVDPPRLASTLAALAHTAG